MSCTKTDLVRFRLENTSVEHSLKKKTKKKTPSFSFSVQISGGKTLYLLLTSPLSRQKSMRGGRIRISKIAIAHEAERRPSMVNQWQAELLARRPLRIITPEIIVLLIRRRSSRRLTSPNAWLASLFVLTKAPSGPWLRRARVVESLRSRTSKPDDQFSKYPLVFRIRCFEDRRTAAWPALTTWDCLQTHDFFFGCKSIYGGTKSSIFSLAPTSFWLWSPNCTNVS